MTIDDGKKVEDKVAAPPEHKPDPQVYTKTDSVMLAAGGTGGHLFPALALAQELKRRGIAVDLITDMRGDRYGSNFPARTVYQVPSATINGRSPVAAANTGLTLAKGVAKARQILGEVNPKAVIGFGGYPHSDPRTECRTWARQSFSVPARQCHCHLVSGREGHRRRHGHQGAIHR
jgi:Glycosyltransferase family 28 N-terminal domain